MSDLLLWPNVGSEEPHGSEHPVARATARLWRWLFPHDASWGGPDPPPPWPGSFAGGSERPAFDWLPERGLCAWWNDSRAAAAARDRARPLWGPEPEVVRRVHDKAFAVAFTERERELPRALRGCLRVLAPEELADAERLRRELRDVLADWPESFAAAATLKPRIGTSGRGRVRVSDLDDPSWTGALPRLSARGGAILEPWLERESDYSVQLYVDRSGEIRLLGSLEQRITASGVPTGHRGELDHRGRVVCGAEIEDDLLGAALGLARAAHAEGFWGPCGVDGFTFRHEGRTLLRPAVELNARFTTGTITLGLLHRARSWLEAAVPSEPGERRTFELDSGEARGTTDPGAAVALDLEGARLRVRRGPVGSPEAGG